MIATSSPAITSRSRPRKTTTSRPASWKLLSTARQSINTVPASGSRSAVTALPVLLIAASLITDDLDGRERSRLHSRIDCAQQAKQYGRRRHRDEVYRV